MELFTVVKLNEYVLIQSAFPLVSELPYLCPEFLPYSSLAKELPLDMMNLLQILPSQ